ncbi:MAG TPA: matrixin family metalloprotease [Thermoanaerobaculia bacterium]|nr:matrixin family metalloprotease [Thermoanaerobaculia bacterium]
MRKAFAMTCLAALTALTGAVPAMAGGALETFDITGATPSPIAGQVTAKVIGIRWDSRCMPVQFVVNNTLNPIPNPLGAPFLTVAAATTAMQGSFNAWNQIPTSFINMQITGTVANPGVRGFDMKNELTFRTAAGFTAIASSPSTSLISDVTFVNGQGIDGDADPDVSSAITVCTDVDGDGDIEFPAGFYKAGTILDNDVQFNTKTTNGYRFTDTPAAMDTTTRSVDLNAIAIHEFGHSFGLAHVLLNNKSASNGGGATMFPFIDTGDPAAEADQGTLDTDDIAWASYFYPEGSAASGPGALQAGDVAFNSVYGLIRGSVTHGVLNQPIAGASVSAIDRNTGEVFTTGYSGTAQLSYNPATGGLFFTGNVAHDIVNGNYVLPVTKANWDVAVEPVDGQPVPVTSVGFTTQIGGFYGQHNFNEEYWNGNQEGAIEKRAGESKNVHVNEGEIQTGINIITNADVTIANFGARDFVGFTANPAGRYFAVRIPASQIQAVNPTGDITIQAAAFNTVVTDNSVVPAFARAMLTTGSVSGTTATVNLANPIEQETGFIGGDNDFGLLYFKNPHTLGKKVRKDIEKGDITDLFLVLQLPTTTPFPGVSNAAPFIGLDGGVAVNDAPLFGYSFISSDGGVTWVQQPSFNFLFALILQPAS